MIQSKKQLIKELFCRILGRVESFGKLFFFYFPRSFFINEGGEHRNIYSNRNIFIYDFWFFFFVNRLKTIVETRHIH